MSNGFVKVHRKMIHWEWYTDSKTLHLFLHLLFKANYLPSKWRGVSLSPGQIITGRRQLSLETGISVQSVRTSLKRLESTHEITIKTTRRFSIITIVNWVAYQGDLLKNDQNNNPLANHETTNKQPTTNHIQEGKEGKKRRNKADGDGRSSIPKNGGRIAKAIRKEAEEEWEAVVTLCSKGIYKTENKKANAVIVREIGGYERIGEANQWGLKKVKQKFLKAYLKTESIA